MTAVPTLSAWSWAGTDAAQREVSAAAKAHGLTYLNNMVNGLGPTLSDPHTFYLNAAGRSAMRFAEIAADHGIILDLTTWITRSPRFIDDAARVLVPLLQQLRAYQAERFPDAERLARLCFDVEDPWYDSKRMAKHKGLLSPEDATARILDRFGPVLEHTVGSGIGFLPKSATVLVAALMYGEVQAYSLSETWTPFRLFKRWWKIPGMLMEGIALRLYRITGKQMQWAYLSALKTGASEFTCWDARSLTSKKRLTRRRINAFFAWVREYWAKRAAKELQS